MVEVVHWNPTRRERRGLLGRLKRPRPVNNFGDLLGPMIARRLVESAGLDFDAADGTGRRLVAVGSILTMARPGDIVWGTGLNGKLLHEERSYAGIDVRAVRGPITAAYLRERGVLVPEVFGDPGLLIGTLWSRDELARGFAHAEVRVVPNLHDFRSTPHDGTRELVSPQDRVMDVLGRIASSDFVCGSSLHGVIIAEALGIPARFVRSGAEPELKYLDYFEGTGRSGLVIASSVEEALGLGPQEPLKWDATSLLNSFPLELWRPTRVEDV